MSASTNDDHGTSVIVHDVHAAHRVDYERWMLKAMLTHQAFPGYLATDVIKPVGPGLRYVVVLRFTSATKAHAWQASKIRAALLKEAKPLLAREERYRVHADSDFWFTPPHGNHAPKRWKQWILSTMAVFPLTVVIPWLVDMGASALTIVLPSLLLKALIATSISGVMVYWLMPLFVRLFGRWLLR
jgi:antibiotic biosynthesis monooxygenase (ABM) superfamily enzyme